ncbi:hypothetical protein GCM10022222_64120 [Amycolatopsis ultiminotia]|uniref:Uncharacterized protein n=1 Tax=Amycolatopsis ultiminotia TaxID=543629 RepID=A0ABP6XWK2_9PSEU
MRLAAHVYPRGRQLGRQYEIDRPGLRLVRAAPDPAATAVRSHRFRIDAKNPAVADGVCDRCDSPRVRTGHGDRVPAPGQDRHDLDNESESEALDQRLQPVLIGGASRARPGTQRFRRGFLRPRLRVPPRFAKRIPTMQE